MLDFLLLYIFCLQAVTFCFTALFVAGFPYGSDDGSPGVASLPKEQY